MEEFMAINNVSKQTHLGPDDLVLKVTVPINDPNNKQEEKQVLYKALELAKDTVVTKYCGEKGGNAYKYDYDHFVAGKTLYLDFFYDPKKVICNDPK
jgi:alanine dehydrogenase